MRLKVGLRTSGVAVATAFLAACSLSGGERAPLDADIRDAVARCKTLTECDEASKRAEGMLVIPDFAKGALVLGGAYGEGGLVVNGETTDYYSLVGSSIGLQLGYRERAIVLMFMTPSALANFQELSGWDARRNFGITAGSSTQDMETITATEVGLVDGAPAYVFVVGEDGLMFDASWNGLKLTRLKVEP